MPWIIYQPEIYTCLGHLITAKTRVIGLKNIQAILCDKPTFSYNNNRDHSFSFYISVFPNRGALKSARVSPNIGFTVFLFMFNCCFSLAFKGRLGCREPKKVRKHYSIIHLMELNLKKHIFLLDYLSLHQ